MTKSNIKREELLRATTMVRPALATKSYVPALASIKFDGTYATAFNDVEAISVRVDVPFKGCASGELLIKALSSFSGETVLLQQQEGTLLVSSGRGKMKIPTLPNDDFPFHMPEPEDAPDIPIVDSILTGIERCLASVGNDATRPAQIGVTLDQVDGKAVLYSTDNVTLSRYQTNAVIDLPGDVPIILPTFFCQQLLTLQKAYVGALISLSVLDGGLLLDVAWGTSKSDHVEIAAMLFTKTMVDVQPFDFASVISKYVDLNKVKRKLAPIPDAFEAAFSRALLVQGAEVDKLTEVSEVTEGIQLVSSSVLGDAEDIIEFEGDFADAFAIDPSLVVRVSKSCAKVAFYPKVMVLADEDGAYLHMIAHCAKPKQG